jgi:hypothetical protein
VNVLGTPSPLSNILSSFFGGIIIISTGFLQFEKYQERWPIYRTTATKLANEYYYWKNNVGDYALSSNPESVPKQGKLEEQEKLEDNLEKQKLALLVRNCESIISSEATEYVGLFTRDRIPGKGNKPP